MRYNGKYNLLYGVFLLDLVRLSSTLNQLNLTSIINASAIKNIVCA